MGYREFGRRLNILRDTISSGIASLSAWRTLMVGDEDLAKALDRYRGFFSPARAALLDWTLMQWAKIFDRHRGVISLINLVAAAKRDRKNLIPYATEKDLQDIEEKISISENLLHRLKNYRDQHLAHLATVIKGETRLPYGEMTQLIEETKIMLESLTKGHSRSVDDFRRLVRDTENHTAEVINIMREELNRVRAKIKKTDT